jgi:TatD DNase family protein
VVEHNGENCNSTKSVDAAQTPIHRQLPLRIAVRHKGSGRDHYGWVVTSELRVTPLRAHVADSHCHMDTAHSLSHTPIDVETALKIAADVGVSHVIQVGCDVESSRWAVETASRFEQVWATVAIHPNDAARDSDLDASLEVIRELAASPVVRGIGETGLDYFRTKQEDAQPQHTSFRAHIDIAREHKKPLVIHDRDAHQDIIDTLLTYGAPETVVFHCFSGDAQMARLCAEHGWYMSFSGVLTFSNAALLREACLVVPDELLLVETDAPFLTPVPFRGQPNSSELLPLTVRAMAQVRSMDEEVLCNQLFLNTEKVFGPF